MKEQFEDLQQGNAVVALEPMFEESTRKHATAKKDIPLPDVSISSRGFMPSEDLVTETRLRCWELVERLNFRGEVEVNFASDYLCGFDDTYTARVSLVGEPTTFCGLGSDPYAALSHALLTGGISAEA